VVADKRPAFKARWMVALPTPAARAAPAMVNCAMPVRSFLAVSRCSVDHARPGGRIRSYPFDGFRPATAGRLTPYLAPCRNGSTRPFGTVCLIFTKKIFSKKSYHLNMSITNDNIIITIPIRIKGIDKNNVIPTNFGKEVEVITT
jgi:hypothetical protein